MAPNDRPSKPLPKDKEKRRRELERLKYERQVARRRASVKKTRRNSAIVGVSVLAVAGIAGGAWAATGAGDKPKKAVTAKASATATASASATAAAAGSAHVAGCTTPAAGKATTKQWKTEPALTIDTKSTYTATISTNCGPITIKLDAAAAPHTVNSFVYLASQHFFDHVTCHRLTTAGIYVLQCGDPTGTGSGGPGYKFKDENLTASSIKGGTYPAGTVAMANSGANTNGSQFFLVYKDSTLSASYTPFGTITGGLSTLQKIAAAGTNNANGTGDGNPLQTVTMNTVTTKKS
ncbi:MULTISPECIES: peptidylprolyl isomerase [Streptacidiphilus]|uniref:Peptidyl-prolyl cis-trans isomerase n=1 Tax=Streptacidiphilus cavernicola TaxID=3342716 RepID=A0ABV6UTE6_9ACTN|nr:peptidylprolyl isomerase [Streptacidiphilus jeojiense]